MLFTDFLLRVITLQQDAIVNQHVMMGALEMICRKNGMPEMADMLKRQRRKQATSAPKKVMNAKKEPPDEAAQKS